MQFSRLDEPSVAGGGGGGSGSLMGIVTGLMAIGIIDLFEIIKINKQDASPF